MSEEIGADMMVVGKRRLGVLKRLLVGCEAERIARYAPCPVVLVGQRARSPPRYKRIGALPPEQVSLDAGPAQLVEVVTGALRFFEQPQKPRP